MFPGMKQYRNRIPRLCRAIATHAPQQVQSLAEVSSPGWNEMKGDIQLSEQFRDRVACMRFVNIKKQLDQTLEVVVVRSRHLQVTDHHSDC
jgi:hypothetical protein